MKKIHQQTFGEGKSIVLVHGWAMHSGIWRKFAEKLAERYRVTCIDLPGHGLSQTVTPFSLKQISTALNAEIENPQCCWLGWSLGATVVLDLVVHFPERVSSLILLAGNPKFTRSYYSPVSGNAHFTGAWPGMDAQLLDTFSSRFANNAQSALFNFLALQVHGLAETKTLLKELKAAVYSCESPDLETLRQGLRILREADLRPDLAKLNMPALAIFGGKDALIPADVGHEMQQLLPQLQLAVLEKAGHVPFLSYPSELVAVISRFMEQQ
ncbi:MAG: pimeloyl-ACP methyl ester esterase BioH [Methylosarcina sp.]